MELRHLRYLVAVAEELHFSRAAQRLHISQPPLSQQIRQLEDELGVRLFHRTRRNVQLTDAGRVVLEEARRTLAQAGEVIRAAERARRGQAGHLRIGFSSSAPYTMLPAILRTFRERFPDVALTLLERSSEEQAHLLFERVSDAGFVRPPIEDSAGLLIVRAILREPLVAALPDSHPLGRARTVAVKSLASEPFVLFPRHAAPGLYDQILGMCRRAGFNPNVTQEAVQMQTIVSLVSAGLGVAIVPASIQNLQRAHVVYRELRPRSATTEMAVAYRRDNQSEALRAFLGIVDETAKGAPTNNIRRSRQSESHRR